MTERTEVLRDTAKLFPQAPEPHFGADPDKRTEVRVVRRGIFPKSWPALAEWRCAPCGCADDAGFKEESDRRFVLAALSAPMSRQVMPRIPSTRLI